MSVAIRIGVSTILATCRVILRIASKYQDKWDDYVSSEDLAKLLALVECAEIVLNDVIPPQKS